MSAKTKKDSLLVVAGTGFYGHTRGRFTWFKGWREKVGTVKFSLAQVRLTNQSTGKLE